MTEADVIAVDPNLVRAVIALQREIKQLGSDRSARKQELARLEELLVEQFSQAGLPDLALDGYRVAPRPQIRAGKADDSVTPERIVDALRASGLEHLIQPAKFDWNRLSSYVRDSVESGEGLPAPLAEVVAPRETYYVSVVQASRAQQQRWLNRPPETDDSTDSADPAEDGESPA